MNRFIAYLVAAFLISVGVLAYEIAIAAPFVVADVDPAADTCNYTMGAVPGIDVPVVVDTVNGIPQLGNRVCKIDVGSVPNGQNVINIAAKSSTWGTVSTPVPFSFARPGTLPPPASIRLVH